VDIHDYETKKRHVVRFLKAGAKVKVTIMFRGREMAHPERGMEILDRLAEELSDLATVESQPKLEGRNMFMMIAPIPEEQAAKAARPKKAEKPAEEEAPAEEPTQEDESAEEPTAQEEPAEEPAAEESADEAEAAE
jgi:translation initiation factor IF-3